MRASCARTWARRCDATPPSRRSPRWWANWAPPRPRRFPHKPGYAFAMDLSPEDRAELRRAKLILENPGMAAKLSSTLGSPVEMGMKLLPARMQKAVHEATRTALMKALDVAVSSMGKGRPKAPS